MRTTRNAALPRATKRRHTYKMTWLLLALSGVSLGVSCFALLVAVGAARGLPKMTPEPVPPPVRYIGAKP